MSGNSDVNDQEIGSIASESRGYTFHLKGVGVFLRLILRSSLPRTETMTDEVFERDTSNPFFQILAEGPSEELRAKVLSYCPQPTQDLTLPRTMELETRFRRTAVAPVDGLGMHFYGKSHTALR